MIAKHEKGLFYNCDEPFNWNHVCKGKLFAFLIEPNMQVMEDKLEETR